MHLLAILSLLSVPFAAAQSCHGDDEYLDGYCYLKPNFPHSRGMNQAGASNYCAQLGYFLPSMHSYWQEHNYIDKSIRDYGKGYHWIGLVSGSGIWSDGSPVDYQNWAANMPTHKWPCVVLWFQDKHSDRGEWRDDSTCGKEAKFHCQYKAIMPTTTTTTRKPTTTSTTTTTPKPTTTSTTITTYPTTTTTSTTFNSTECVGQSVTVGNRCYSLFNTPSTNSDAAKVCADNQMTLAVFDSIIQIDEVIKYVNTVYSYFGSRFWIGLRLSSNGVDYVWPRDKKLTYDYWMIGYPMDGYQGVVTRMSDGRWENAMDFIKYPFICSSTVN